MPRKKAPPPLTHGGLFTIFGLVINLNSILTTVVGAGVSLLVTNAISDARANKKALTEYHLNLSQRLDKIEKEQSRVSKEYVPPIHPTPTPTPCP